MRKKESVVVYRGMTIQRFLRGGSGLWWVARNGISIAYVRSIREGKHYIDSLIGADRARIRKIRGNGSRISRPNPAGGNEIAVMVYGRVLRIEAQKTQPHKCDPDCAAVGHRYYHDFQNGAVMYGLKNGDLLIRKVR